MKTNPFSSKSSLVSVSLEKFMRKSRQAAGPLTTDFFEQKESKTTTKSFFRSLKTRKLRKSTRCEITRSFTKRGAAPRSRPCFSKKRRSSRTQLMRCEKIWRMRSLSFLTEAWSPRRCLSLEKRTTKHRLRSFLKLNRMKYQGLFSRCQIVFFIEIYFYYISFAEQKQSSRLRRYKSKANEIDQRCSITIRRVPI